MPQKIDISDRNHYINMIYNPYREKWFERTDLEIKYVMDLKKWYRNYFTSEHESDNYYELRIICPVKDFYTINNYKTEIAAIVPLEYVVNNPKFHFPIGHPVANTLYVVHPYDSHTYIPYINHEIEFLKDRLQELTEIAQDLGAKEIDVKVISESYSNSSTSVNKSSQGSISSKFIGLDGNGSHTQGYTQTQSKYYSHLFNRHQTFSPTYIKAPEDTIWLQGEPTWQGLIKQRLKGQLLTHKEILETSHSQAFNSSSIKQFQLDIKSIFAEVGLSWGKEEEKIYSTTSNIVISVDIKFEKLNKLGQNSSLLNVSELIDGVNEIKDKVIENIVPDKLNNFFGKFLKKE